MYKRQVKNRLLPLLRYDFTPEIEIGKTEANEALNSRLDDNISLTGRLNTISANQFEISDGGFMVVATAIGNLSVAIGEQ